MLDTSMFRRLSLMAKRSKPSYSMENNKSSNWKKTNSFGGNLTKIVAYFELNAYPHLPDGSPIKIKITEDKCGNFIASINACIINEFGMAIAQAGMGNSEEEALENVLQLFNEDILGMIAKYGKIEEKDIKWASAEEF